MIVWMIHLWDFCGWTSESPEPPETDQFLITFVGRVQRVLQALKADFGIET